MSLPTQEEMDGNLLSPQVLLLLSLDPGISFAEYRDAFSLSDTEGDGKIDYKQI